MPRVFRECVCPVFHARTCVTLTGWLEGLDEARPRRLVALKVEHVPLEGERVLPRRFLEGS